MKATDFLSESENIELQTLTEGPLGSLIKAAGKGIGKAVGGVAKGAGAVAGGVAGIGSAFKKGYQSGKTTVAGDDDETPATTTAPAASTAPATAPTKDEPAPTPNTAADPAATAKPADTTKPGTKPAAPADPNATPKPTAVPKADTDTAKPLAGTGSDNEPPADAAKETEYAKALKFVKGLPVAQQKELVTMLQKDPKVTAALNRPAANKAEKEPDSGLSPSAFGQMAKDLAGAAQKQADSKPKEVPAAQPQTKETPPADNKDSQADLKARLKSGQGLAKTSGGGFKQGIAKGNMRLGAGRGGVSMSYVPQGNMLGEGFSLFRKQK